MRIIGGEWRGRKLRFPRDVAELRPTPDRVRETLFNWLRDAVPGSRCLDLFAGSGALGFEALSRGASEVLFVDRDARVVRYLAGVIEQLGSPRAIVARAEAIEYLRAGRTPSTPPFDLIFVDPPYGSQALAALIRLIDEHGWLRRGGWLYLEHPASERAPELPGGWMLTRSGRAGSVGYHLARSQPDPVADTGAGRTS